MDFQTPKIWESALLNSIITIKYQEMKEIKISNYQDLPDSYRNWLLIFCCTGPTDPNFRQIKNNDNIDFTHKHFFFYYLFFF